MIATHVDAGYTAPAAVDLVYQVYGRNMSVTMVINKMLEDRKRYNGRPHPRLCIRTAGQPRLHAPPAAPLGVVVAAPRPAAPPIAPGAFRRLPGRVVDREVIVRHERERADRLAVQQAG